MRNPIPQAVCVPTCVPTTTAPPVWSGLNSPGKILNVNVNVNVNKQEGLGTNLVAAPAGGTATIADGAALEQRIREAVNNALDED